MADGFHYEPPTTHQVMYDYLSPGLKNWFDAQSHFVQERLKKVAKGGYFGGGYSALAGVIGKFKNNDANVYTNLLIEEEMTTGGGKKKAVKSKPKKGKGKAVKKVSKKSPLVIYIQLFHFH
jgi:hypothetical protein